MMASDFYMRAAFLHWDFVSLEDLASKKSPKPNKQTKLIKFKGCL